MNLKDAFRFQNKIKSLMSEAEGILVCDSNLMEVKTTCLCKKVMPEAENETTVEVPQSEYADRITEVVQFLAAMLEESEKLSAAVRKAKNACGKDLDSETSLNARRQHMAELFRHMADLRASETLIPGGGTGYRFNQEGNQVPYRCDLKRVATIHFDRKVVRAQLTALSRRSDEVSAKLDRCLINTPVDYEPPFDVNDSFAEIFEGFAQVQ